MAESASVFSSRSWMARILPYLVLQLLRGRDESRVVDHQLADQVQERVQLLHGHPHHFFRAGSPGRLGGGRLTGRRRGCLAILTGDSGGTRRRGSSGLDARGRRGGSRVRRHAHLVYRHGGGQLGGARGGRDRHRVDERIGGIAQGLRRRGRGQYGAKAIQPRLHQARAQVGFPVLTLDADHEPAGTRLAAATGSAAAGPASARSAAAGPAPAGGAAGPAGQRRELPSPQLPGRLRLARRSGLRRRRPGLRDFAAASETRRPRVRRPGPREAAAPVRARCRRRPPGGRGSARSSGSAAAEPCPCGEGVDDGPGEIQAFEEKVPQGVVVAALAVADARQGGLKVVGELLQRVEPDEPGRSLQRVDRAEHAR